jgi:protein-S-isoprenylcysteine O-methyltransferase Ste14
MEMTRDRAAKGFALAAYLLALGGQGVFVVSVLLLGLDQWPRREPVYGLWPWVVNISWLAVFGLQHSGMARASFKTWLARWWPAYLERSLYVALAGLLVLFLALSWQPIPGEAWWRGPPWVSLVAGAGVLGVVAVSWCFDHLSFFGLRQAWRRSVEESEPLQVAGPYQYVRHPLMACFLVFLWGHSVMTPTLALLSGGLTLYVFIAIGFEERDLLRRYGKAYAAYRRRVPVLVPWRVVVRRRRKKIQETH